MHLCIYLSVCLSVHPPIFLPIHPFIHPSNYTAGFVTSTWNLTSLQLNSAYSSQLCIFCKFPCNIDSIYHDHWCLNHKSRTPPCYLFPPLITHPMKHCQVKPLPTNSSSLLCTCTAICVAMGYTTFSLWIMDYWSLILIFSPPSLAVFQQHCWSPYT